MGNCYANFTAKGWERENVAGTPIIRQMIVFFPKLPVVQVMPVSHYVSRTALIKELGGVLKGAAVQAHL